MTTTTDLDAYRQKARSWLHANRPIDVPTDYDEQFAVCRDWQQTLFENGWLGIHWPKEVGGQGLTIAHHLAFAEELVASGAPQPSGTIGLEVVGPTIVEFGTAEQKVELLPRLLRGDDVWCQGFSEPDAGSDLASLRTSTHEEGDTFVVTGQKVWTSWADQANKCALLVRTTPLDQSPAKHKGLSYLLVDMDTPGITVRPLVQMTGNPGFSEVFFDDVVVPKTNVLGQIGSGWTCALKTLSAERSVYVIRCRVEYETTIAEMIRHLRANEQIISIPSIVEDLGESVVAIRALHAQTQATAERIVSTSEPAPEDSLDKLLLAEVDQTIFSNAFRLLGSGRTVQSGTAASVPRAKLIYDYLYSRAASIYGGTSQVHRNIVGQRLLGLPRLP